MGFGLIDPIAKEHPKRIVNVGIAEQNMVGIAAGLCNAGFRPVCYTISNFLIHRSFEQIRNDICLHNYPITLVGTSTGFDNGMLGPTHQVIDDIGCVKVLPNIKIYSPSTVTAADLVFKEVFLNSSPAYVRIGKGAFDLDNKIEHLNHFVIEKPDNEILIITHGNILENCIEALRIKNNFSIFVMNRIHPINRDELESIFNRFKRIVVVEDHFVNSGLYNSICQCYVESNYSVDKLASIAIPVEYAECVGDKDYFAEKYGFSAKKISQLIIHYRTLL